MGWKATPGAHMHTHTHTQRKGECKCGGFLFGRQIVQIGFSFAVAVERLEMQTQNIMSYTLWIMFCVPNNSPKKHLHELAHISTHNTGLWENHADQQGSARRTVDDTSMIKKTLYYSGSVQRQCGNQTRTTCWDVMELMGWWGCVVEGPCALSLSLSVHVISTSIRPAEKREGERDQEATHLSVSLSISFSCHTQPSCYLFFVGTRVVTSAIKLPFSLPWKLEMGGAQLNKISSSHEVSTETG